MSRFRLRDLSFDLRSGGPIAGFPTEVARPFPDRVRRAIGSVRSPSCPLRSSQQSLST